jgi:hypothetical protein
LAKPDDTLVGFARSCSGHRRSRRRSYPKHPPAIVGGRSLSAFAQERRQDEHRESSRRISSLRNARGCSRGLWWIDTAAGGSVGHGRRRRREGLLQGEERVQGQERLQGRLERQLRGAELVQRPGYVLPETELSRPSARNGKARPDIASAWLSHFVRPSVAP